MSWTVTLKLPLAVLLCASVAEQFTAVVPAGKVLPEAGEQVTATAPSTRSNAEAVNDTAAPATPVASVVISADNVRTGAIVSCTVTLKLPLAVLLLKSDAEQLIAVVPRAKVLPEAGEQVTGREPSTASFAVTEKLAIAPEGPVASRVISAGSVRTGGVVSSGAVLYHWLG